MKKLKDILRDKSSCYATSAVHNCNFNCKFYWSCKAYKKRLEFGEFTSRTEVLENNFQ